MAEETYQTERDDLPLVSVSMTAYNSAAWLPRAIESVLRQQRAFLLEIVIGDDCSQDRTAAILHEYCEKNPTIIRVLDRPNRLGMQRNYYDTFQQCRGKYIAWLDADDYWTDPDKLGIQIALLEADESISVCGHFVRQVNSTGDVSSERCPLVPAGRYGVADIIAENFIPSPSLVFRNGLHRSLPQAFFKLTGLVDWPVLLQGALAGDIVLLDRVMADYVLTPGSAYQGKGPLYQDSIDLEFYEVMGRTLPPRWQRTIRAAKGIRHEAISYHLLKQGKLPEARKAAHRAFSVPHPADNLFSKIKARLLVEVFGRIWKRRANRTNG